jgi:hypothetical protein
MANPSIRVIAIVALVVLVMGVAFGAYYQSTTSTLDSQDDTISELRSSVKSLQSHPLISTTTVTSTTTQFVKTTSAQTLTNSTQETVTLLANLPFTYPWFITPPNSDGSGSPIGLSESIDDAILFSCPNGTATGTCTAQLNNSTTNLATVVTMSYPQFGQEIDQEEEPGWANCIYDASVLSLSSGVSEPGGWAFGYCVQVAPCTFIIAQPSPPPE